ncbi:MAG: hypothetical protein L0J70_12945, partial [Corynebacterium sp.]|nr:hypothetical protein [Corynebacterium sp.]
MRSLLTQPRMSPAKPLTVAALAMVPLVTLSGCAEQMIGTDGSDDGDGETVVGVAAKPLESPDTDASDVTGTLDSGEALLGLVRAGVGTSVTEDSPAPVAALEQGRLVIGPLEDVASGSAPSVDVDDTCTTVTGAVDGVVLGCGRTVSILDAEGQEVRSLEAPGEVTAAAVHPDGKVALTVESDSDVHWFDAAGEETSSEAMTAPGRA